MLLLKIVHFGAGCSSNSPTDAREPDETGGEPEGCRAADAGYCIKLNTSPINNFPTEQMQMPRFDGTRWLGFGEVMGN